MTNPQKGGRIPFDLYDYQFDWLSDRASERSCLKARQVGMSETIAAEALHCARFQEGATILFVSKSLDAAINLMDYCKDLLLDLDDDSGITVTKKGSAKLVFNNRSRILSMPASQSTGRTYAATRVYMDEVAFMPWADTIYSAVSPTVARGGSISLLSTPFGQGNFFHELIEMERYGSMVPFKEYQGEGWSFHRIHWSDCPAYTTENPDWYSKKRPGMDEAKWYSEFECDFEKSGQPVFRSEDIKRAAEGWNGWQDRGIMGRSYVTAWDIGRRRDATVGITIDVTEPIHQVVCVERVEAMPIPNIQDMILRRFRRFPGVHIVEANDKGDAVIENIDVPVGAIEPFWTTLITKRNIITSLQWALEAGMLKFDSIGVGENMIQKQLMGRVAQELKTYQWDDKLLVQDTVMALAMAEHKFQWREENEEVYYDAQYNLNPFEAEESVYNWDEYESGLFLPY